MSSPNDALPEPADTPAGPEPRARVQAALDTLTGRLRAAGSAGWQRIDLMARMAGDAAELEVHETRADGSTGPAPVDEPPLLELLRELRDAEYEPENGAWFSLRLFVPADGDWWLAENRVWEPAWRVPPADETYREDLDRYPREDTAVPPWLAAKVPSA